MACRHLICWLLLTTLLLGAGMAEAPATPTFADWQAACARLPTNRSLRGRPPKAPLPLPTFAAVEQAVDAFNSSATNGPLGLSTNWVLVTPRRETFFDVNRSWFTAPEIPFEPFAEKLLVPSDATVFLQGDLHGDVHSLLAVLGRLQEREWLDGFNVAKADLHMIFLGDYTDRGAYGIEVLYTLLRLKTANPDRVHLVRGNHEDINLVARYGFLAEGQAKYGASFQPNKILRAYDFLPVVLYLGVGSDFVQLCHGGMEPGFDPASLLAAPGSPRFQLIGTVAQATFLRGNPEWLKGDATREQARGQFRDFTPATPTTPGILGFMWNDFSVFGDDASFV
ncbi:MAG TPA: metallophosphoesterase family protein, partial [Verrucomicrobiota bacterium]|nr:metallophosphoesterase family protein [Verrucomicrobiota bacterium]